MFSLFRTPKFCHSCGKAIVHGPRTVYGDYDTQTGVRREKTTQEWWCPEVENLVFFQYHDASFKYA